MNPVSRMASAYCGVHWFRGKTTLVSQVDVPESSDCLCGFQVRAERFLCLSQIQGGSNEKRLGRIFLSFDRSRDSAVRPARCSESDIPSLIASAHGSNSRRLELGHRFWEIEEASSC